jgi:hypothetical protein
LAQGGEQLHKGDFTSCCMDRTIARLKKVAGVEIDDAAQSP